MSPLSIGKKLHSAVKFAKKVIHLPHEDVVPATFGQLIEHFREQELHHQHHEDKSYATQETYKCIIDTWILPKWRDHPLAGMDGIAVKVEKWLRGIKRARGTKAKIRNVMSAVCSHGMRWGWMKTNPIRSVRQSAKRERVKLPLALEELQALYEAFSPRERALLMLDVPTGMRVGELLALQWWDFDFKKKQVQIKKSIWRQHLGPVKTEASEQQMPLTDETIAALMIWRRETEYHRESDWVFASHKMKGKQPYWPNALMKTIRNIAKQVGITKPISWHVFRHTFSSLLVENDEDVKTVQSLMRHANVRVTLETYTLASSQKKRAAQNRVVSMILPNKEA